MDIFFLLPYTICVVILFAILPIVRRQYVIRQKIKNIPHTGGYPFIGVIFRIMSMSDYERLTWYLTFPKKYPGGIYVEWIGIEPVVSTFKPEYLEHIFPSTVNITKGIPYDLLKPWLGNGLLTSTGKQWFHDRRLIGPTFHFSILDQFAVILSEQAEILTKCLEKEITKDTKKAVNVFPFLVNAALDIICETAMGVNIHAQESVTKYTSAVHIASRSIIDRMVRPWYMLDSVYYSLPAGKEFKAAIDMLHGFTKKGHDTTAVAITWALFLLGSNPEHQEKVHEELEEVFGNSDAPITVKDLPQLKYLDRVIKETLRLFPSVPVITRLLTEDVKLGDHTLPKGISVALPILLVHRNPKVWPDPIKFDPDRFLPENSKLRNPYAYVPFSAGPRNCIGQKFAQLEEKIVLSAILRKWRVKSVKTFDTIKYGYTIILRPQEEVFLHFTPKQ
ncbi:hypothetical protein PUN28_000480 [Cardiocondyla obscurior]|uniref:Cytochrome P450 n=1 Tax=Cardiocondyla obscurior TaxID=286306 RepID=A0AAW2GZP6_9HYME